MERRNKPRKKNWGGGGGVRGGDEGGIMKSRKNMAKMKIRK